MIFQARGWTCRPVVYQFIRSRTLNANTSSIFYLPVTLNLIQKCDSKKLEYNVMKWKIPLRKCSVIPPNSNTFSDWRRACHVSRVKTHYLDLSGTWRWRTAGRCGPPLWWDIDSIHTIYLFSLIALRFICKVGYPAKASYPVSWSTITRFSGVSFLHAKAWGVG